MYYAYFSAHFFYCSREEALARFLLRNYLQASYLDYIDRTLHPDGSSNDHEISLFYCRFDFRSIHFESAIVKCLTTQIQPFRIGRPISYKEFRKSILDDLRNISDDRLALEKDNRLLLALKLASYEKHQLAGKVLGEYLLDAAWKHSAVGKITDVINQYVSDEP